MPVANDLGTRFGRQVPVAQQTVPRLLELQAERWGAKVAVRIGDRSLTFAELPVFAARRAQALTDAGVARGDRVAALCSNRLELLELILGCAWLGAIAVPLNTASRGEQLAHMLDNAAPKAILIEREFGCRPRRPAVRGAGLGAGRRGGRGRGPVSVARAGGRARRGRRRRAPGTRS